VCFTGGIEPAMCGQNKMSLPGNQQAAVEHYLAGFERAQFFLEYDGIENHPISNQVNQIFAENTRRNSMQDVFITAELQGVTGIWASLKAGNHIVTGSEIVNNFAFPFVAPLQTEDNINFVHWNGLACEPQKYENTGVLRFILAVTILSRTFVP
jgi:hypothetical protein